MSPEPLPAIPDDAWFKSSYSSAGATECVEAALLPDGTAVRDSLNPRGPQIRFTSQAWEAFTGEVRVGRIA